MINNIELIKPLLNFTEDGDFYMLYVMKRKKDQPEGEKDNHQSVRIIKTYCVGSIEYLEKRYEEVMMLCEVFRARAYIHVQKQNHTDVSLEMMMELARRIKNNIHIQEHLFDTVVGQLKVNEKRWVIDIDTKDEQFISNVKDTIFDLKPAGDKVEAIIPTKSGFHLITKRFDSKTFSELYTDISIQKKNPTLLYFPDSLELIANSDKYNI
jgi:hypothetical protein